MHLRALLPVCAALATACSPALDWREIRPEGSDVVLLLPCKPERFERTVEVAGAKVRMRMQSCAAAGATWAISHFELADPAAVPAALDALRNATGANLGAAAPSVREYVVRGATAYPQSGRAAFDGKLGDGSAAHAEALFFAKGLHVHQASVVGARPAADAGDAFFGGIRLAP